MKKKGLFIIGFILVAVAILLATLKPFDNDVSTIQSPYSEMAWEQAEVSIGGKSYKVLIKEYPDPVALSKAMEGFVPSDQARKSALGTLALTYHLCSQMKTKDDLEAAAQLFEFPEKSMAFYAELQSHFGGWDELIIRIHNSYRDFLVTRQLMGEAIIGDKHVFIIKLPDTIPMFNALKQMPDGKYCLMNDWDRDIKPILVESRILQLFKGIKDEP